MLALVLGGAAGIALDRRFGPEREAATRADLEVRLDTLQANADASITKSRQLALEIGKLYADKQLIYESKIADLEEQVRKLEGGVANGPHDSEELGAALGWLRGVLPREFGGMTRAQLRHLRVLDLSRSPVDPADIGHLVALPALAVLNVSRIGVTDDALAAIARIDTLETLIVDGGHVTDAGFAQLAGHRELEHLSANFTGLTDAVTEHLAAIPNLREVRLDGTKITDEGLLRLQDLPIERLGIGNTQVSDLGLARLESFRLKELSLYRNTNLTDAGMQHLTSQESLETLMMRGVPLTEAGLAALASMKSLRTLNASLVMNDAGMRHLRELTQLRDLAIYSCPDVTDRGIGNLRDLVNLEKLSAQFTKITDEGLRDLEDLPRLRILDVRGTGVTPEGVAAFRERHPGCRVLH